MFLVGRDASFALMLLLMHVHNVLSGFQKDENFKLLAISPRMAGVPNSHAFTRS